MSPLTSERQSAKDAVAQGATSIMKSLAELASLAPRFPLRELPLGRCAEALSAVARVMVAETHLIGRADAVVGILMSEELALRVASGMLIMPRSVEFTEELLAAFDEAINIAIGVWNPLMRVDELRWDNSVGARTIRTVPAAGVLHSLGARAEGFAAFDLELDGHHHPVILYGRLPFAEPFPTPSQPAEVVAPDGPVHLPEGFPHHRQAPVAQRPDHHGHDPRDQASTEGNGPTVEPGARASRGENCPFLSALQPPRSGRPTEVPPAPSARSRDPLEVSASAGDLDAALAFVDRTGALKEWLLAQLKNPEFVFSKTHEPSACGGGQVIVLVDPTGLHEIKARKTIVMRRAQET